MARLARTGSRRCETRARGRRRACGRSAHRRGWGTSRRCAAARGPGRWPCRSLRQEAIVDVAPRPALAGLDGGEDRVPAGVEVLGGVAIGRRVAAADMPAGEAFAQVDPFTADLQAVLAAGCRSPDVVDLDARG